MNDDSDANSSLDYRDEKLTPMRKIIARRMTASKSQVPHYYLTMTIDMRAAVNLRNEVNESSGEKISFNDFIIKAVTLALQQYPIVNASFQGETIRYHEQIHIGVAVALTDGLVVVVIRNCQLKTLHQIAREATDLAERAKMKRIRAHEVKGSTFTISNLGMYGVDNFTAVINQPEAAILAVSAIQSKPMVENEQIVVGQLMQVTLACDHRVIDGAVGAAFLKAVKQFLENPSFLLN